MSGGIAARLGRGWGWFVDGLVEAVLRVRGRGGARAPFRLVIGEGGGDLVAPDGAPLGWLAVAGGDADLSPPDLAGRLAGRPVDLVVPDAWLHRRDLAAVAAESRPYLDAYARHQIERVTPWRAEAVHYRTFAAPLPSDRDRLAVSVVAVPRRPLAPWIRALDRCGAAAVRIRSAAGEAEAIPASDATPRGAVLLRRWVGWGVAAVVMAIALLCGVLEWQAAAVGDEIAEQDRVLDQRRVVLARARAREGGGDDAAIRLRRLRDARLSAAAVIDALAAAVPDTAYLTSLSIEGDRVAVAGVSTEPLALVPALETSGRFGEVAAAAATTRTEAGGANRFGLTMRVRPPAPARP